MGWTEHLDLLIGVPIGILVSMLSWWILFHGLKAKITFSPKISKIDHPDYPGGFKYRFKMCNNGSRAILDVEYYARFKIRGLRPRYPDNYSTFSISLGSKHSPFIEPKGNKLIRIDYDPQNPINSKHALGAVTIEDLLKLGEDASITIYAFGFDSFSGSRHMYTSKPYAVGDIGLGFFFLESCLELDEGNTEKPRKFFMKLKY